MPQSRGLADVVWTAWQTRWNFTLRAKKTSSGATLLCASGRNLYRAIIRECDRDRFAGVGVFDGAVAITAGIGAGAGTQGKADLQLVHAGFGFAPGDCVPYVFRPVLVELMRVVDEELFVYRKMIVITRCRTDVDSVLRVPWLVHFVKDSHDLATDNRDLAPLQTPGPPLHKEAADLKLFHLHQHTSFSALPPLPSHPPT